MKKNFVIFLIIMVLVNIGLICYINSNDYIAIEEPVPSEQPDESHPILDTHGDFLLSIKKKMDDCIPVILDLYDNNVYELMTEYKSCKPGDICTMDFRYVNSITGTYEIDTNTLLDNAILYTSDINKEDVKYIIEKENEQYVILKSANANTLESFLQSISVDLNTCATASYNY